jgi:hypothetical protein
MKKAHWALIVAILGLISPGFGQSYKVIGPKRPAPNEPTARQVFEKAMTWFKALGWDMRGKTLSLELETEPFRYWKCLANSSGEAVNAETKEADIARMLITAKGEVLQFVDFKLMTLQNPKAKAPIVHRPRYVLRMEYYLAAQKLMRAIQPGRIYRFLVDDQDIRNCKVRAYELHNGIVVDQNLYWVSIAPNADRILGVGFRREVEEFDDSAKVKITRSEAIAILREYIDARFLRHGLTEKRYYPNTVRLFYSRREEFEVYHQIPKARPFYFWNNYFVDAETGSVWHPAP